MSDWSHGYNVSVGYTYGFYRELAPDWLDFCARIQGFVPPDRGPTGAFRYLEMGSGQGLGLCLLAALYPNAEFFGVDFNPEHIAHARQLAAASGLSNVSFIEGDFSAMAQAWPAGIGECDYITLHGIYSWIPPQVRADLVTCLGHASRSGALIYLSYNCMPGWLSTVPFQHLARQLQVSSALPGPVALAKTADILDAIVAAGGPLNRALPGVTQRSQLVRTQDQAYAVQEYLHDNWHPLWFGTVSREFSAIKSVFVGSAHVPDALMPSMMPPAMRDLVNQQTDPILRGEIMDCLLNQGFRRDVFCRGPRRAFGGGNAALLPVRLVLGSVPKDEGVVVTTNIGEVKLPAESVMPFVKALEQRPHTIAELLQLDGLQPNNESTHLQAILLLVHTGIAMVAEAVPQASAAQNLNKALAQAAAAGAPYSFLAAPGLATAFKVRDLDCILLTAWMKNPSVTKDALGQALVDGLNKLGRGLAHEGQTLSGFGLLEHATRLADTFLTTTLPRWQTLGAVAAT